MGQGPCEHKGNETSDNQAKLSTKNWANKIDFPVPISWAKQLIKQGSYKD